MGITISEETYCEMRENNGGFCLACGDEAYGVEPDACRCKCDSCGDYAVYGVEELLIMGAIEFMEGGAE